MKLKGEQEQEVEIQGLNHGERKLWAAVLSGAFYSAVSGETLAQHFFKSAIFAKVSFLMDLPTEQIRKRVQQLSQERQSSKKAA